MDKEALSIDIVESKASRAQHQEELKQQQEHALMLLEEREKEAIISRKRHAVAWLSVDVRDQEEHYERISSRRHDETCKWVMRQTGMESWMRNHSRSPLLWLNGKPGAGKLGSVPECCHQIRRNADCTGNIGKSVMCSYIVRTLLEIPGLDTLYYFCTSQDSDNICTQILKTLALQILRQHQDAASLIANDFVYKAKNCGIKELRVLVPQLLELSSYTRIVLDGLDECSKPGQKAVLKELHDLCLDRNSNCKILLSSRKEVYLAKKLSAKPQIVLDGHEGVDSDIRLYVKYKIGKLRTSDLTLLTKIESILVDKANGM